MIRYSVLVAITSCTTTHIFFHKPLPTVLSVKPSPAACNWYRSGGFLRKGFGGERRCRTSFRSPWTDYLADSCHHRLTSLSLGGSGGIEPPESSELQVKNIVKNMYRNDKTFLPLWYYHSIFGVVEESNLVNVEKSLKRRSNRYHHSKALLRFSPENAVRHFEARKPRKIFITMPRIASPPRLFL